MATGTVTLNCARVETPDLAAIDQLARISLGLQRCGCELRLQQPTADLVALIELAGLADLLRVQVKREAEKWKEPGRVEEEGELADPPVA
jgi:ABC-type transporter Mla MlaB component